MHYIYILLCIAQFLLGVSVIVIVTMQESKNEGLTGQIGTTMTSSFKGKAGREDRLNDTTRKMAIAFFVVSALVAFGTNRW
jgi:preprotein translocase subunit SecG